MARLLRNGPTPSEIRYRRLLEEFAASGQKQSEFAAQKGIVSSTLSWWRGELPRREQFRAELKVGTSAPQLVPVHVLTKDEGRTADFVVEVRSRRFVAVKRGFD